VPFAFHPDLDIVVDTGLADREEIFFNVGLADRSISMRTAIYLGLTRPRMAPISTG